MFLTSLNVCRNEDANFKKTILHIISIISKCSGLSDQTRQSLLKVDLLIEHENTPTVKIARYDNIHFYKTMMV